MNVIPAIFPQGAKVRRKCRRRVDVQEDIPCAEGVR